MFNIYRLFNTPYGYYDYIWIDVALIKETKKAILIEFDGIKAWLPKVWILRLKRVNKDSIRIKISLYCWSRKF